MSLFTIRLHDIDGFSQGTDWESEAPRGVAYVTHTPTIWTAADTLLKQYNHLRGKKSKLSECVFETGHQVPMGVQTILNSRQNLDIEPHLINMYIEEGTIK